MIVGRSDDGEINRFQIFYFLLSMLMGRKFGGFIPQILDYRIDTIPVDLVARGIVAAIFSKNAPRVLNHCSGPVHSLNLQEIRALIELQAKDLTSLRPIPLIYVRWFFNICSGLLSLFDRNLGERYSVYSSILEYAGANPRFMNIHTLDFYLQNGIPAPNPSKDLEAVIRHFLKMKGDARG
jgi:hypothetical protein